MNQNNYNSNWKKVLGLRNMQEKLEKLFCYRFLHQNNQKIPVLRIEEFGIGSKMW